MRRKISTLILFTGYIAFANAEEIILENTNPEIRIEIPATDAINETGKLFAIYQYTHEKPYFHQQNQYRIVRRSPQEEEIRPARRGYIGLGLGGAIALDSKYDYEDNVGGQFTVNFGYLFTRRVGIAASLIYSSYEYYYYGTSGFVAGPLFSFGRASGNFSFDLRPGVGYASAVDSYKDNEDFIYDIGASFRWGIGRYISMSANFDYYDGPGTPALGISFGVNYRLK